ncbi:hypothetical protein FM106_24235 [Brachybacterium faecium]|nr:hypothetical protein FM106_24235 [Brachybacterium faecium]
MYLFKGFSLDFSYIHRAPFKAHSFLTLIIRIEKTFVKNVRLK